MDLETWFKIHTNISPKNESVITLVTRCMDCHAMPSVTSHIRLDMKQFEIEFLLQCEQSLTISYIKTKIINYT